MKYYYYQHSYTRRWYVISEDNKVCKSFNTQEEAEEFISFTPSGIPVLLKN